MASWEDPVSDLTESEGEEDYKSEDDQPLLPPRTPTSSKSKKGPKGLYLRAPRPGTWATDSLFSKVQRGRIDLDPSYQRDVVWSQDKQSNLIDSLIYHYYVPPLIFSASEDEESEESWVCIDGKQRISSIIAFMRGDVPHKDSVTGKRFWYLNKDGKRKTMMPEALRKKFDNIQIVFSEYQDLTIEQQRAIFQRVQNGVALTPAERMQSLNGFAPALVRNALEMHDTIFGPKPGANQFKAVAQILLMIDLSPFHHPPKRGSAKPKPIEKEVTVTRIETFLQQSAQIKPAIRDIFLEVMKILEILITHDKFSAPFHTEPEPTPMEYVLAAHLVHTKRTQMSLIQLSSLFDVVRNELRKNNGSKPSAAQYKKLMKLIAGAADSHPTPAVSEKADYLTKKQRPDDVEMDDRVSGTKRGRTSPEDESSIPEQTSKKARLTRSTAAQREFKSEEDNYSDDEASVRPIESVKSRKTRSSTASVAGLTKKAGPSKALTKVKKVKTVSFVDTQSALVATSAPSSSKSASLNDTSNDTSNDIGTSMTETSPETPTIPMPVPPTTTPSEASSGEGASSQAAPRLPGMLKNVLTKGLPTVGTRTSGPGRDRSIVSAPSSTTMTPVSAGTSSQPTSALLDQCSKTTSDPRLRPTPPPLADLQPQPSHQPETQQSTNSSIGNPSAVPAGPSTLVSYRIHQSDSLNIDSTVTTSNGSWSQSYRYQYQK
ncbi:hypothetical protein BDN72DRAFT_851208 [Pluteus cervinus]|uniref:Uncharacterized protein n=1 Tax=Pluteus cervinus TaxID=181527 RepID=A0ACD3A1Q5_9AGAR|nr:hypothetical protein BDN72DRAFT_851208 [Pluteus cervinus]